MESSFSSIVLASFLSLTSPSETTHIETYQLPAIAGLWQIDLDSVQQLTSNHSQSTSNSDGRPATDTPHHNQTAKSIHTPSCQERYNFGADGKFSTTSGEERTVGEYRFSYLEDVSLPVLAAVTTFDNNKPDCAGEQINQTDHSFAVFVKLDSRHDPKRMQWCEDKEGKQCTAVFERVLP